MFPMSCNRFLFLMIRIEKDDDEGEFLLSLINSMTDSFVPLLVMEMLMLVLDYNRRSSM